MSEKGIKRLDGNYRRNVWLRKNLFRDDYRCLLCKKEVPTVNEFRVCIDCEQNVLKNDKKRCLVCSAPIYNESDYCLSCQNHKRYFKRAYAPLLFKGDMRELVLAIKYGVSQYAYFPLASYLFEEIEQHKIEFDVVAFVPQSKKVKGDRAINLSKKLAETVAGKYGKPLYTGLISLANSPRHLMKGLDRIKDFPHLFKVEHMDKLKDKRILLVDDVITTGTTSNSITIALQKAKPDSVIVLCLCH